MKDIHQPTEPIKATESSFSLTTNASNLQSNGDQVLPTIDENSISLMSSGTAPSASSPARIPHIKSTASYVKKCIDGERCKYSFINGGLHEHDTKIVTYV